MDKIKLKQNEIPESYQIKLIALRYFTLEM